MINHEAFLKEIFGITSMFGTQRIKQGLNLAISLNFYYIRILSCYPKSFPALAVNILDKTV